MRWKIFVFLLLVNLLFCCDFFDVEFESKKNGFNFSEV